MPGVLYATRDFDLIENGVGFKMKPNLDSVTCFTSCSNFDFICATLQLYIDKHFWARHEIWLENFNHVAPTTGQPHCLHMCENTENHASGVFTYQPGLGFIIPKLSSLSKFPPLVLAIRFKTQLPAAGLQHA